MLVFAQVGLKPEGGEDFAAEQTGVQCYFRYYYSLCCNCNISNNLLHHNNTRFLPQVTISPDQRYGKYYQNYKQSHTVTGLLAIVSVIFELVLRNFNKHIIYDCFCEPWQRFFYKMHNGSCDCFLGNITLSYFVLSAVQ